MNSLMSIVKRSLFAVAKECTKAGKPLMLTSLERKYLIKYRPRASALPQVGVKRGIKGWEFGYECAISPYGWADLLEDLPEDYGLAVLRVSSEAWIIGLYTRTNPLAPSTARAAFVPMTAELGPSPEGLLDKPGEGVGLHDVLLNLVEQLEADFGMRLTKRVKNVSDDLDQCYLKAKQALIDDIEPAALAKKPVVASDEEDEGYSFLGD